MTTTDYSATNSKYLQANPTWHIEDSPWKATQILKMMERNKLQPHTIAEIGCGAGEILNQLHQRMEDKTIEFSGYEIAPDAFKLCMERSKERLSFFQEDILQINNKYELLLMIDVFEHIEDYLGFLRMAASKATYKIYHIPLDVSILSIWSNYPLSARKNVGHLHHFMKDTALATLEDTGQQVIDWFYTKSAFEVHNKSFGFFGKVLNLIRRFFYWIKPDFAVKTFGGFSLIVLTK